MLLSNCSLALTEIPEQLAAGGRPSSAAMMATSEQRTSEQVPPEAPVVEHAAMEERRVPEPRQETPEQSTANPSTQEGVIPDAVARGKTLMVLSDPERSLGYADAGASQRQEEAEVGQ
jgi:hypothetical protein